MPRLGIPANIQRIRARFRQPGPLLNPLALTLRTPLDVVLERSRTGSRLFAAYWADGQRLVAVGTRKRAVIPQAEHIRNLFEAQIEPWRAYREDGTEEPLIADEIQKQIAEFRRRPHPRARRQAAGGNRKQRRLAVA